jgi:hypothetical protein
MTSSIGPANKLALAIASQLTRSASVGSHAATTTPRARRNARTGGGAGPAPRDLNALIASRVREVDREDPQRGRKAFRIFLEVALLSRCGEELINDPAFRQLVDDVHGALEADPGTKRLVDSAVDQLLNESSTRA